MTKEATCREETCMHWVPTTPQADPLLLSREGKKETVLRPSGQPLEQQRAPSSGCSASEPQRDTKRIRAAVYKPKHASATRNPSLREYVYLRTASPALSSKRKCDHRRTSTAI